MRSDLLLPSGDYLSVMHRFGPMHVAIYFGRYMHVVAVTVLANTSSCRWDWVRALCLKYTTFSANIDCEHHKMSGHPTNHGQQIILCALNTENAPIAMTAKQKPD